MTEDLRIKRKDFLARCGSTFLGLGMSLSCSNSESKNSDSSSPAEKSSSDKPSGVSYRTLGKPGIKVTEIGYGASRTMDPALINYAFEKGINFFDTGRSYSNGQNEVLVGKVFKGKRQQVVINSKVRLNSLEKMRKDIEASLEALNTDYIDCMLIHDASKPEHIQSEIVVELLSRAREEGKIRTFGFSSHSNFIELLNLAAEKQFHEVIMVPYNFLGKYTHMLGGSKGEWDAPGLEKAISRCGQAGIDFISMKGCSGGFMKDDKGRETYRAALKWILQNPYMKTTATAMGNFQQIDENVGAMGGSGKLGHYQQKLLDRYARLHGRDYCRMCGTCSGQCPYGVQITEINRLHMYASGYGGEMGRQARITYSSLGPGASPCLDCKTCAVDCAYGLPLGEKLKKAHAVLS